MEKTMNNSANHGSTSTQSEHPSLKPSFRKESHPALDSLKSRTPPKLSEFVTVVLIVVAGGAGMFWIRDEGEKARKATEARLLAEISRQSKRIESLEANLADIPKALQSVLTEHFDPVLKSAIENRRIAEDAIRKAQSSPTTPSQRAPTPQTKQRTPEEEFLDAFKSGRVKQVNKLAPSRVEGSARARLPLMTGDHPNALQPEDLKTPALQKLLRSQRAFELEMKTWLLDDHTNTPPPQEEGGVYSTGFTK